MAAFEHGGNAVDAAVAANAAIAVTAPHLCGMGGDLFALVRTPDGDVYGLNATGRAGSGVSADALRAERHTSMPFRHDPRTVTVPGCVDGWMALHERFGRLDLATVLHPAITLAAGGFPASPLLVGSLRTLDELGAVALAELVEQATERGAPVRRPGVALALQAIVAGGRDAFYGGAFGGGLLAMAGGVFSEADLLAPHADWVEPLTTEVLGVELHTIGPNSQGYLALGAAAIVDAVGWPADVDDAAWPHLLAEASALAGRDRPDLLHEDADGNGLVSRLAARAGELDPAAASATRVPDADGDTTYLCTADADGWAVSLIQSNASGFGSWLVEPTTGINLHNRGLGFNLIEGHPAELAPGRRPPHTLCPAMATRDGELAAVFGTMGGDAQPQIVLQLAARLFANGASAAEAVNAPRWAWRGPVTGFDTWTGDRPPTLMLEGHSPAPWRTGLLERGHDLAMAPSFDSGFGHAHAIVVEPTGSLAAAADPRARVGAAAAR